ncbi:hypothetical protein AA313_de0200134 [Arthrobotrys entomopaga]|nr:hypothetical protein AA313_de0200134 [Arthrobotrys entomopaga]
MASLKTAKIFDHTTRVTLKGKKHNVDVPARSWDYQESRDLPGIKEVWSQLNKAKLGFYDTAEGYGNTENEKIMGRLLKDTPEADRKDIIIATKCIEGIAKQLAECVDLGLTKTVGVSNYNKEQMIRMHDALAKYGVPLASNQIEFNLLRRVPESSGLLAACHERGIVPLAYSPLAMGRLTGKYNSKNPPPSGRIYGNQSWEKIDPLLDAMKEIGDKHGVPLSAVALNWTMCKGTIPLGGARNGNQCGQNIQALGFRLTDEELAKLDELAQDGKTIAIVQAG